MRGSQGESEDEGEDEGAAPQQQPAAGFPISRAYEPPARVSTAGPSPVAAAAEAGLAGAGGERQRSLTERSLFMNRRGYVPRCEWRPVPDATCALCGRCSIPADVAAMAWC